MAVVRRIGVLSLAKITGALYAILGLIIGACISLFAVLGSAFASKEAGLGGMGMMFGVGAIVILPIFYGLIGFISSLIGAAIYNGLAGWLGGVELELQ
jgi:hypothetical protein